MPNSIGSFSVDFAAAEALEVMMGALGTAARVNRDYEGPRRAFDEGENVNIRRPSRVQSKAAPIPENEVDDLRTGLVTIPLTNHEEAKYGLTDKEITFAHESIMREHIIPGAYSIAKAIEISLLAQAYKIPHCQAITGASATQAVLTNADKIMTENDVPEQDRHYVAGPRVWNAWQNLPAFTQQQGAGDQGVSAQTTGRLGPKFGFSPYRSNNLLKVAAQASPTITSGAINGAATKGATSIAVDATALSGTFKAGMVIQIGTEASTAGRAYNDQLYSITADVTASGNAATLQISPPLRADVADNTAFTQKVNASAGAFETELAFHRNALALCVVPMPMQLPGVEAMVATDGNSGISVRLRKFYSPHAQRHFLSLDALWGVQVLEPDAAVRGIVV